MISTTLHADDRVAALAIPLGNVAAATTAVQSAERQGLRRESGVSA
jgi:hypothetical protein